MEKEKLDKINGLVNKEFVEKDEIKNIGIFSMGTGVETIKGKEEKGERMKILIFDKMGRVSGAEIYVKENVIQTDKCIDQLSKIIINQIKCKID